MVFSINVGSGVIEADFVMATLNPEGLSTGLIHCDTHVE